MTLLEDDLPDFTACSAELMSEPHAYAAGYGNRQLLAWLAASERGSLEELIVSAIAASAREGGPAQIAGQAMIFRHVWDQLPGARRPRATPVLF